MLTDQELQSLRNLGNEAEQAADEIGELRTHRAKLLKALTTCAESAWREGVADERKRWQRIATNAQAVTSGCADKIDYSEVPSHPVLGPLPPADHRRALQYDAIRYVLGYPESYLQEYARAYAAEQVAAERERWADAGREVDELTKGGEQ